MPIGVGCLGLPIEAGIVPHHLAVDADGERVRVQIGDADDRAPVSKLVLAPPDRQRDRGVRRPVAARVSTARRRRPATRSCPCGASGEENADASARRRRGRPRARRTSPSPGMRRRRPRRRRVRRSRRRRSCGAAATPAPAEATQQKRRNARHRQHMSQSSTQVSILRVSGGTYMLDRSGRRSGVSRGRASERRQSR